MLSSPNNFLLKDSNKNITYNLADCSLNGPDATPEIFRKLLGKTYKGHIYLSTLRVIADNPKATPEILDKLLDKFLEITKHISDYEILLPSIVKNDAANFDILNRAFSLAKGQPDLIKKMQKIIDVKNKNTSEELNIRFLPLTQADETSSLNIPMDAKKSIMGFLLPNQVFIKKGNKFTELDREEIFKRFIDSVTGVESRRSISEQRSNDGQLYLNLKTKLVPLNMNLLEMVENMLKKYQETPNEVLEKLLIDHGVNPEFFQKAQKEQVHSRLIAASSLPPILDRLDWAKKGKERPRHDKLPPVKNDKLHKQKLPKARLPESLPLPPLASTFINPKSWAEPNKRVTGELPLVMTSKKPKN